MKKRNFQNRTRDTDVVVISVEAIFVVFYVNILKKSELNLYCTVILSAISFWVLQSKDCI